MSEKPTHKTVNKGSATWLLTRPVTAYLQNRLAACFLQIMALNEAHKTMQDAADALNMEVQTLRNYIAILGVDWRNITRKPRKPNNLPK